MRARCLRAWQLLGEVFWILPALVVLACAAVAFALLAVDQAGLVPRWLLDSPLIYSGDATGARTLLGAVASSTIGVAGTVFSITIAALTLAAGQMGPRLLRNFTRDRGNQLTLGVFLGTFSYALLVLRTVRGDAGGFTPHASLSFGVLLAFVSVGMLIYFVEHIAGRINVDTVIDLVSEDVGIALRRLTVEQAPPPPPAHLDFSGGQVIAEPRRGYLQHLDDTGLADWAHGAGVTVHLLVRPGDYVFPGAPVAVVLPPHEEAVPAIRSATALGSKRLSAQDLEFAIRQLEEVAVRALSPGINDPHTAMSVLVRFGSVLCDLAPRFLSGGVTLREGRVVLVRSATSYDGLTDSMFDMIRQNPAGWTAVLAPGLAVMTAAASVERTPRRLAALRRHADLWLADARRDIANASDLADVEARHASFRLMESGGPLPREWRDVG